MSVAQSFEFHPLAAQDITDIWEFIAQDSLLAARRVREEILEAIQKLVPFPHQGASPFRFDLSTFTLLARA